MSIINVSLCLSDLPKESMKKSEKNGKIYINLAVKYVGQGKAVDFTLAVTGPESVDAMPAADEFNGLPF